MAFTPCAFHGGKYAGGAHTFFLRLVDGNRQVGGKLQVCAADSAAALEYLAKHTLKVSEGDKFLDYGEPLACGNCGGDISVSWTFYGNAYPRGQAESQWYGKFCNTCVEAVTDDLHLASAKQRPA